MPACIWPNGYQAADNFVPCPNGKHCCATGESCLSNKLCFAAKYNTVYRGACADPSWPISECPRICYEGMVDPRPSEVDYQWANLYACPKNHNQVFTCGTSSWSEKVCRENLGNYTWVEGHTLVAQLSSDSTSAIQVAGNTTQPSSSTSTCSPSEKSSLALGAGLGFGLGLPWVLLSVAFVWFYARAQRKIRGLRPELQEEQSRSAALDMSTPRLGATPRNNRPRPELH